MNILETFVSNTKGKYANIGIGLGNLDSHNLKILEASLKFLKKNKSKIYLFGTRNKIKKLSPKTFTKYKNSKVIFVESEIPEIDIIQYLKDNKINSVIRGNLSSSNFLNSLKEVLHVSDISRLALLETVDEHQFFFGPVGIDECNTLENKIKFVEKAIVEIHNLKIEPIISILSGGRIGDLGRDKSADYTIKMANEVVEYFRKRYSTLNISHDEILIENSLKKKSNLIIAPNGVSGNLIYRTLVHLGGGKAYGAIYMGLDYPIIDTSRVGKTSEIEGALILILAKIK